MNKAFKRKGKLSFFEAYKSRPYLEQIQDVYGNMVLIQRPKTQGVQISFSSEAPATFDQSGFKALDFTPLGYVGWSVSCHG